MKLFLIIITAVPVIVIISLFILGAVSSKKSPNGLISGRLDRCPESPNCVCSEPGTDQAHFIEPLWIAPERFPNLSSQLKAVIRETGGRVTVQGDNYIAARYKSRVFKFTDDLEIRLDPSSALIYFRSASRVGYSDFNVNRKRIEKIKKMLSQKGGN